MDTHYGVPNPGPFFYGQLPTMNYPIQSGYPIYDPSQHAPQYDDGFTYHQGSDYFSHHQRPYNTNDPYDRRPIQQPNPPEQNDMSSQNPADNFNPNLPNDGQPNTTSTDVNLNPNPPNENVNTDSPIADRLQEPSPATSGDQLGAFISSNIFEEGLDSNFTISPTGLLVNFDDSNIIGSTISRFSISCDQPFDTRPMPDFRAKGRRISDVRKL